MEIFRQVHAVRQKAMRAHRSSSVCTPSCAGRDVQRVLRGDAVRVSAGGGEGSGAPAETPCVRIAAFAYECVRIAAFTYETARRASTRSAGGKWAWWRVGTPGAPLGPPITITV